MTQYVHSISSSGLVDQLVGTESDKNYKASLSRLCEILCAVDRAEMNVGKASKKDGESVVNDILSRLGSVVNEYMQTDPVKAQSLMHSLAPMLSKYAEEDEEVAQKIVLALQPAIKNYLAVHPNGVTEVLKLIAPFLQKQGTEFVKALELSCVAFSEYEKGIEGLDPKLVHHKIASMLGGLYKSQGDLGEGLIDSPYLKGSLGTAMLFLQQFQISLSKAQANQDKLTATIGKTQIEAAQEAQKQVSQKIAQIAAEKAAAANRPWYDYLIEGLAVAFGAILGALTGGIGAGLVAVMIGAFMMSPAFNDAVSGLAEAMGGSEGAEIAAKLIMTIVVVVASVGAGYATASEEIASTAVSEVAEDGADAGTGMVGTGGSSGSRGGSIISKRLAYALKLGATEGFSTFAATNIWMDFMMLDPTWVKNHETLAAILDGLCEIVTMIAAGAVGYKCLGSMMTQGEGLLENSPRFLRGAIIVGGVSQAAQAVYSACSSFEKASIFNAVIENTKIVGKIEARLERLMSLNTVMSAVQNTNDTSASNITQAVTQEMKSLEEASGSIWKVTSRNLTR